jgi:hypothetical protein
VTEKPRPKRRRKPQKPGKTAKMNERHFVKHNYHDHAMDTVDDMDDHAAEEQQPEDASLRRRGGVSVAFPLKLHAVLDQVEADGLAHVISWQPHGRCFVVHEPKKFVDHVMPKYFRQTKLTSFQRQLNLYGFCRLTRGNDSGGYYHELFLRNKVFLCQKMIRTKVKGTRFKAASSPDQEPDFYTMPPVAVTPANTSDEESSFDSGSRESVSSLPTQPTTMPSFDMFATNYAAVPQNISHAVQSFEPRGAFAPLCLPQADDADRVLDEAVEELFLNEAIASDSLDDFVHDWDPSNEGNEAYLDSLQDDCQLGMMLERLLED